MASLTKTVSIFDDTLGVEVMNVRLHGIKNDFGNNETFNVASVQKSKTYDFSLLRQDEEGKTFFDYQEGTTVTESEIEAESTAWDALVGVNTITVTFF